MQSMPDVSPVKWHLAHTTWFFETFLLAPLIPDYVPFHPAYAVLYNSYYNGIGDQHPRSRRGLLSRPSLDEVLAYRDHVDGAMLRLLAGVPAARWQDLLELGLQHEQQHQELAIMDIQHVLSCNPLQPAFRAEAGTLPDVTSQGWVEIPGGLHQIGHVGPDFGFDNETPRHRVWLEPFAIADRLVTAGEYLRFIEAGGYQAAEYWLSDGWSSVQQEGWLAPLYWRNDGGIWTRFSLEGRRPLDPTEPVLHLSYFEADAYARWAGCRLPTEAEWEVAASQGTLQQVADRGWQWTASAYSGYPGFAPAAGAVGEYNGKFMINQMVLRGGSFATPPGHSRITYRNFFPPTARWAFSALRLARF